MESQVSNNANINESYNGNDKATNAAENGSNRPSSSTSPQYTLPGILHFLQYEWHKFEFERNQWDTERAELQTQLCFLKGEVLAQLCLKKDLIRRIKMLEFCLRQERMKNYKIKYNEDPPPLEANDESNNESLFEDSCNSDLTNINNWKQGRQLLRQYLQEIGYTDTIIDVRSTRVRSLLGLNNGNDAEQGQENNQNINNTTANDDSSIAAGSMTNKLSILRQMNKQNRRQSNSQQAVNQLVTDAETSAMATFEFLKKGLSSGSVMDDVIGYEVTTNGEEESMDSETEEVLAEFDFLSSHQSTGGGGGSNVSSTSFGQSSQLNSQSNVSAANANTAAGGNSGNLLLSANKGVDIVDIGELAALSINDEYDNEASSNFSSNAVLPNRKTWNPRYLLKSHFDCIRCLRFHSTQPLLVTASEDETLKLWDLNKIKQSNKNKQMMSSMAIDLEPVYTYRGHTAPVLCLILVDNLIYSGARNGEILIWQLPSSSTADPYETYDPSLALGSLKGHTDAIWSLAIIPKAPSAETTNGTSDDDAKTSDYEPSELLCSASADCTIRIWNRNTKECLKTIVLEDTSVRPTCLAAFPIHHDTIFEYSPPADHRATFLAASFTDGSIAIYDLEQADYAKPVAKFTSSQSRINSIVIHPYHTVILSAHENRCIKFWDFTKGTCLYSMVAHLDEVSSLDCDPSGLYLLSGSHDCSVRLWHFESKTCIQEITSHRKKFDEAILDVSFHRKEKYFGSAGAEALAKVFV